MKTLLASLLFLPSVVLAGQKSQFLDNPKLNTEFEQSYFEHKYGNFVTLRASTATITQLNVSSITAIQVSAAAIAPAISAVLGSISSTNSLSSILSKLINLRLVQYQTATNTGVGSTNSTNFGTMMNGPAITLTSASNYVLLIWVGPMGNSSSNVSYYTFTNGGSNLGPSNGLTESYSAAGSINAPGIIFFIDTAPGSTTPSYSLAAKTSSGASNATIGDSNLTQYFYAIELGVGR